MAKEKLPTETQVQQAVISECKLKALTSILYRTVIGYPGQRGNDPIWLKIRIGEGLAKGFPDLLVLVPSRGYNAAFIELKVTAPITEEQLEWAEILTHGGFLHYFLRVKSSAPVMELLSWYFLESENTAGFSGCIETIEEVRAKLQRRTSRKGFLSA